MRCKACNKIMDDDELKATNIHTGAPEDLCRNCKGESIDAALELMTDAELQNIDELDALGIDIYTD